MTTEKNSASNRKINKNGKEKKDYNAEIKPENSIQPN